MKKSTLNAVMIGVIICLVIAISVVSIKLAFRPKVEVDPAESFYQNVNGEGEDSQELISEEEPSSETIEVVDRVRITGDNINVRSGPGTDYERLGSAYRGYDFELVQKVDAQWTKIIYDGKEAYVFNEYIEIIPMVLNEDGTYSEYISLE